jgi:hypothetical protein
MPIVRARTMLPSFRAKLRRAQQGRGTSSQRSGRLAETLLKAEKLARRRRRSADDATLSAMGVDTADWSIGAVRAFKAGRKRR